MWTANDCSPSQKHHVVEMIFLDLFFAPALSPVSESTAEASLTHYRTGHSRHPGRK